MLTSDTKKHIDSARQVLVGVVPNPASQIDQITNALIYKFMDDMDQMAIKAGGKPSFFIGDLERYAWTRIMDPRLGNQERMNLYSEALVKFSEAKQLPELFRNIFKSAFLPYRSPDVLGLFLKEISFFDYKHSEELGNAYEYLLSIMSSQGDAGQFRTPRHVIDFIVDVVNPTKGDKILDPACGTAGFLISAYKHILKQHDGKDDPEKKEKPLSPDDRKKLVENFEGYDIDPTMARIAQVNMYLHQFKNPKIFQYDSLSSDERWNDKFDVILANPPFMSPKGGIRPHSKFSVQSSRSEVLFVDYITNHLRPNGRAGIIVPEGVIFQNGSAYKQLRKKLVEDGLYAVVSLPSGVFSPYSGVKTSILFFDNELVKQKNEILFAKVQHDGTDLGAKKRIILDNDLPIIKKEIEKFRNGKFSNSAISHSVKKELIIGSGDYNLSGDRYRIDAEVQSEFDLVALGDLLIEQSERVKKDNDVEVWSVSNKSGFVVSSEYFDKQVASTDISNYKIIRPKYFAYNPSRINVGSLAFNSKMKVGAVSPMYVVFSIRAESNLLEEYLLSLLKSQRMNDFILQLAQGAVRQQLKFNDLKRIKIPLPPIEIQRKIVAELNSYQRIINGAREVYQAWKPQIEIDKTWEIVKIGDICKIERGGSPRPIDEFITDDPNGLNWIKIGDTKDDDKYITKTAEKIKKEGAKKSRKVLVGDFVLSNSMSFGRPYIMKIEGYIHDGWLRLSEDSSRISKDFLYYILSSNLIIEQFEKSATGGVVRNLNSDLVRNVEMPLPSIEIQKLVVEKIEAERILVEGNKRLIEMYDIKNKDLIAKIWRK